MSKLDYLEKLKLALRGLPPASQAKTLGWCEQRFVDGVAAGKAEADIAAELGEPYLLAQSLRASLGASMPPAPTTHATSATSAVHATRSQSAKAPPLRALRTLGTGLGLTIFNIFMAVPALVYAALLISLYAVGFSAYVAGIAITTSALAGNNELLLKAPLADVIVERDRDPQTQTRITINERGIHVTNERPEPTQVGDTPPDADKPGPRQRAIERAEAMAERTILLSTELDPDARGNQVLLGIGMILGGIVLFLLSLVVTRYTWLGIKRYVNMNITLLKGA